MIIQVWISHSGVISKRAPLRMNGLSSSRPSLPLRRSTVKPLFEKRFSLPPSKHVSYHRQPPSAREDGICPCAGGERELFTEGGWDRAPGFGQCLPMDLGGFLIPQPRLSAVIRPGIAAGKQSGLAPARPGKVYARYGQAVIVNTGTPARPRAKASSAQPCAMYKRCTSDAPAVHTGCTTGSRLCIAGASLVHRSCTGWELRWRGSAGWGWLWGGGGHSRRGRRMAAPPGLV